LFNVFYKISFGIIEKFEDLETISFAGESPGPRPGSIRLTCV